MLRTGSIIKPTTQWMSRYTRHFSHASVSRVNPPERRLSQERTHLSFWWMLSNCSPYRWWPSTFSPVRWRDYLLPATSRWPLSVKRFGLCRCVAWKHFISICITFWMTKLWKFHVNEPNIIFFSCSGSIFLMGCLFLWVCIESLNRKNSPFICGVISISSQFGFSFCL